MDFSGSKPGTSDPKPTQPTEPKSTTPPETTVPPASTAEAGKMDYEKFQGMSPSEQQDYVNSFNDLDAFFDWYNSAKDKHEAENPPIDVGDGNFDMGDLVG